MSNNSNHPEKNNNRLLKNSITVAVMTMISRVLGLARDIILAKYFGSSVSSDTFFVAFKVPNFLRRLFAEGAFSQAFIPVLAEYQTTKKLTEIRYLISNVSGVLAGYLILVSIIGVIFSPLLVRLFAPGFIYHPEKLALTADLLRITFPYIFFISLTAFAGSILNSHNNFAIPAFTPALLNISLISAVIFLSPKLETPVMALAFGVLLAGIAQLLFQMPFLLKLNLLTRPRWNQQHEGVKRIMTLMIPAIFGVSVSQINTLIDTILASFFQTGSVSWLYYSDRLSELPLGVFAIAISTVILPALSKKHTSQSHQEFATTLTWAIRLVLLISLPASTALIMLAEPLITTFFQYGKMTIHDVTMSSMSLQAYGLGLIAMMLIKVLATGYYSRQDIKTPVKIAIIAMIVNMILNLILAYWLQHVGLALATSLTAFLNTALLFRGLIKDNLIHINKTWFLELSQLCFATTCMGIVLFFSKGSTNQWIEWSMWNRIYHLTYIILIGLSTYFLSLWIIGMRPRHFKIIT